MAGGRASTAAAMLAADCHVPFVRPPASLDGPAIDGTITITPLKAMALRLRFDHPLRLVLMAEPDRMAPEVYLSRLELWLRLLSVSGP